MIARSVLCSSRLINNID